MSYRDNFPTELFPYQVNELRPEVLGIHATNPGVSENSPSRSTMYSSHVSQHLVTDGSQIPLLITGTEVEYSKYTTSDRIPFDARVVQVIDRYPRGMTENSLQFNPEKLVVICNDATGLYDVVPVKHYQSLHQYFGYKNKLSDKLDTITSNSRLAKDTVLGDTPANVGDFYTQTVNLNCMLGTPDLVAEDSVIVCEDILHKFTYRVYERRTVSVGAKRFPVAFIPMENGTLKSFYDIGDEVPADGALMWTREYIEGLAPVTMSKSFIKKIDYIFDTPTYARQGAKGKVVDIRVIGNTDMIAGLPPELGAQFNKYRQAYRRYCERLLECERRIFAESRKKFGTDRPKFSGRLITMLTDARAFTDNDPRMALQLLMNKHPIDEFMIEFVVEYELTPTIGGKMTGIFGDKGVITAILPRHRMPRDRFGNSADIVMSSDSTVSRTNFGRLYMMDTGAASMQLKKDLQRMTGLDKDSGFEAMEYLPTPKFKEAWNHLSEAYEIMDPKVHNLWEALVEKEKRLHITECLETDVVFLRPTDGVRPWPHIARMLKRKLGIEEGPVTHQLVEDGKDDVTKENFLIAPYPIILLDKTAEDTLTVATAAHGPFGVLIKHNAADKYSKPWKDSPPRAIGESEGRAYAAHTMDPMMIAEMHDRANNPAVQLDMSRAIMHSETPGNIPVIVDRRVHDFGNSQPHGIANNMMECYGLQMKYVPEDLNPTER